MPSLDDGPVVPSLRVTTGASQRTDRPRGRAVLKIVPVAPTSGRPERSATRTRRRIVAAWPGTLLAMACAGGGGAAVTANGESRAKIAIRQPVTNAVESIKSRLDKSIIVGQAGNLQL